MVTGKNVGLLSDQRVQEEIGRHRWIESEKAGHDIGYDIAAQDWLDRYSEGWLKHNMKSDKCDKAAKSPKRSAKRISKK